MPFLKSAIICSAFSLLLLCANTLQVNSFNFENRIQNDNVKRPRYGEKTNNFITDVIDFENNSNLNSTEAIAGKRIHPGSVQYPIDLLNRHRRKAGTEGDKMECSHRQGSRRIPGEKCVKTRASKRHHELSVHDANVKRFKEKPSLVTFEFQNPILRSNNKRVINSGNSVNYNAVLESRLRHSPAKKKLKLHDHAHKVKGIMDNASKEYLPNSNSGVRGNQMSYAVRKNQETHPDEDNIAEDKLKANDKPLAVAESPSNSSENVTKTESNNVPDKQQNLRFQKKITKRAKEAGTTKTRKIILRKSPKRPYSQHDVTKPPNNVGEKIIYNGSDVLSNVRNGNKNMTDRKPKMYQSNNKRNLGALTLSKEIKKEKEEMVLKDFRRNLSRKSKQKKKIGLHVNFPAETHSERETPANVHKRRLIENSLDKNSRNKRNNILYEIKDFILKNFPRRKRKRKSYVDHRKSNAGIGNVTDGNVGESNSEIPTNLTTAVSASGFDTERSIEILEEVKDFVVKNFHAERLKRRSSLVESSSSSSSPAYDAEEENKNVIAEKVKRGEIQFPPFEEMANVTLKEYDDEYLSEHPKRDIHSVITVPKNDNSVPETKDLTDPSESEYTNTDSEFIPNQPVAYSTEFYDTGEEYNNMTEAFSDEEIEGSVAQRSYDSNLSKGKRESTNYRASEINGDSTVTEGSGKEKENEISDSLEGSTISGNERQSDSLIPNSNPTDLLSSTSTTSVVRTTNMRQFRAMLSVSPSTSNYFPITSTTEMRSTVKNVKKQIRGKDSQRNTFEKHESFENGGEEENLSDPTLNSLEKHGSGNQKEDGVEYDYDDSSEVVNGTINTRSTMNTVTETYLKGKVYDSENNRTKSKESERLSEPTKILPEKPEEKSHSEAQEEMEYDYESSTGPNHEVETTSIKNSLKLTRQKNTIQLRRMDHLGNLQTEEGDGNDDASNASKHFLKKHQDKNGKLIVEEQDYNYEGPVNLNDPEKFTTAEITTSIKNEAENFQTEDENRALRKHKSKKHQEDDYEDISDVNVSEKTDEPVMVNTDISMQNSKNSLHIDENSSNSETLQGVDKQRLDFSKHSAAEHQRGSQTEQEEREYEATEPNDSIEIITHIVTHIPENSSFTHSKRNNVENPKFKKIDKNDIPSMSTSNTLEKSTSENEEEEEYDETSKPNKSQEIQKSETVGSNSNTATLTSYSLDKTTNKNEDEDEEVEYEYESTSEPSKSQKVKKSEKIIRMSNTESHAIHSLNKPISKDQQEDVEYDHESLPEPNPYQKLKGAETTISMSSTVTQTNQDKSATKELEEDVEYDYENNSEPSELQKVKEVGTVNNISNTVTSQTVLYENEKRGKIRRFENNKNYNSNSFDSLSYPLKTHKKTNELESNYEAIPRFDSHKKTIVTDKKDNSRRELTQNESFLRSGRTGNLERDSPLSENNGETRDISLVRGIENQDDSMREEGDSEYSYEDSPESDNSEIDSTTKMNNTMTISQNGLLQDKKVNNLGNLATNDKYVAKTFNSPSDLISLQKTPLSYSSLIENDAQMPKSNLNEDIEKVVPGGTPIKDKNVSGLSKNWKQNEKFTTTSGSEANFQKHENEKFEHNGTPITYAVTLQNAKIKPQETTTSFREIRGSKEKLEQTSTWLEDYPNPNDTNEEFYDEIANGVQDSKTHSKYLSKNGKVAFVQNGINLRKEITDTEDYNDDAKDSSSEYEDADTVASLSDDVASSASPEKEAFKGNNSPESKYATAISDTFENKHSSKIRENGEQQNSLLNSVMLSKLKNKRNKYESLTRVKTRKAREVLAAEPTVFPKFIQSKSSFTKQWLIGIIGLVAVASITLGIYQIIPKRRSPKALHADDLREVYVEFDRSNPQFSNRVDESYDKWLHDVKRIKDFIEEPFPSCEISEDRSTKKEHSDADDSRVYIEYDRNESYDKWFHDVKHIKDFIEETLQNCEISEDGSTKEEFSTSGHLSKIHAAVTGTIE